MKIQQTALPRERVCASTQREIAPSIHPSVDSCKYLPIICRNVHYSTTVCDGYWDTHNCPHLDDITLTPRRIQPAASTIGSFQPSFFPSFAMALSPSSGGISIPRGSLRFYQVPVSRFDQALDQTPETRRFSPKFPVSFHPQAFHDENHQIDHLGTSSGDANFPLCRIFPGIPSVHVPIFCVRGPSCPTPHHHSPQHSRHGDSRSQLSCITYRHTCLSSILSLAAWCGP